MIILTNCLTEVVDEGCRKVANSLIRRLKAADPACRVISYESSSRLSDVHMHINKWMLSPKLARYLCREKEPVLYVPSPAKMLPLAIRLQVLSLFAKKGIRVILPMQFPMGKLARWLFPSGRVQIIALSRQVQQYYEQVLGKAAMRLKVGVDLQKFVPAPERRETLRQQYGLPKDKPIVLHVGHLKQERNIEVLTKIDPDLHVVLAVSTQTADQQDAQLRKQLQELSHITVFDTYLPHIEELYQLADVYLFPVTDPHGCISSPISVLEAAACGIPVVTTPFGAGEELLKHDGFYEIGSFDPQRLNALLRQAYREKTCTRTAVTEYDWDIAVRQVLSAEQKEESL